MDTLGLLRRWVPGTRFTEIKRPRRKSTEVKMHGTIPPLSICLPGGVMN